MAEIPEKRRGFKMVKRNDFWWQVNKLSIRGYQALS
jgi:hypothetical protein